jgi:hypothetical protein
VSRLSVPVAFTLLGVVSGVAVVFAVCVSVPRNGIVATVAIAVYSIAVAAQLVSLGLLMRKGVIQKLTASDTNVAGSANNTVDIRTSRISNLAIATAALVASFACIEAVLDCSTLHRDNPWRTAHAFFLIVAFALSLNVAGTSLRKIFRPR